MALVLGKVGQKTTTVATEIVRSVDPNSFIPVF